MTYAFNKFDCFQYDLGLGRHVLGTDQLKLALTNTAPAAGNAVLADLTEITYTNLSTRNVTTTSWAQSSGTAKLICADLTLTASGGSVGPFRYVVLYNSTPAGGRLIGYYDRGASITLADTDSLVVDFDGTAGVFTDA